MLTTIILDSKIKDMKNLDSKMEYVYKSLYDVLQTQILENSVSYI